MTETTASPFAEATKVKTTLKVLLFGDAGTGKTHLALSFPQPVFVIDMERGTVPFSGRFPFEVAHTNTLPGVVQALEWLIAHPGAARTVVIDPLSVVSDNLRQQYAGRAERRAVRNRQDVDDADMTFKDWAVVKRHWKEILNLLMRLDANIVLTCREAVLYEKGGKGEMDLHAVGYKPQAETGIAHYPDSVFRVVVKPDGKRFLETHKDRWGVYAKGTSLPNPSWETFQKLLDAAQAGETTLPGADPEAEDRQEAEYLADSDRQAAQQKRQPPKEQSKQAVNQEQLKSIQAKWREAEILTGEDRMLHWQSFLEKGSHAATLMPGTCPPEVAAEYLATFEPQAGEGKGPWEDQ